LSAKRSNNVSDFVLAICDLKFNEDGSLDKENCQLIGTCFLIGSRGYALTAAHVLEQMTLRFAHVLFSKGGDWDASLIERYEIHPTEDIGILQLDLPRPIASPITFAETDPYPNAEYSMWAHPEEVAYEFKYHNKPIDFLDFRPSPVYFKGYLGRKIDYSPNPSYGPSKGSSFYEVSEIAGACSSGSPLSTLDDPYAVFAIYAGEERAGRKCGYAANLTKVIKWVPQMLGKTIVQESA
jgi:hypothetical protein